MMLLVYILLLCEKEMSVYPKTEFGVPFKPHMIDIYVETFNNKTFNRDGNESGILTKNITIYLILYFNKNQLKRNLNK